MAINYSIRQLSVSHTVFPAPRTTPFWLKKVEYCSAESKMLHMRHICTLLFFAINAPQVKHLFLTWGLLNFLESNGSCPRCWQYSAPSCNIPICGLQRSCDAPVPEQENLTEYSPFLTLHYLWLHLSKGKGLGYISNDTLCEQFTYVNFCSRVGFF